MNRAAQLLLNTTMNVSEIGYEVGFADPSYFSRAFTWKFSISPSVFRKQQLSRQLEQK